MQQTLTNPIAWLTVLIIVAGLFLAACADETVQPTTLPNPTEVATIAATAEVMPTLAPPTATSELVATAEPIVTPEPEEERVVSAEPQIVTFAAVDGLELVGTLYPAQTASPAPGVLLLHMLGGQRSDWDQFATLLAANGYTALTLDMRGHGETGGRQDWATARDDLLRARQFLADQESVAAAQTAVVGASIGANMALITGAGEPEIATVVLLSPGLDYRGVTTEDALAAYGDRPLLIVAANGDSYAADSSRTLAELAGESAVLQLYEDSTHGTRMFAAHDDLDELIIDWLSMHLR